MKKHAAARPRRRLALGIVFGTAVFVSVAGALAFKSFYDRPGNAALRYVPADAVVVATIDLTPSPSQTLAFKRIEDSLNRNGLDPTFEKSILELFDHSKATKALHPLVLRNGAACIEPKDEKSGSESGLVFIAVTDGAQASQILQKNAFPQFYKGLKYYKTGGSSMLLMVVDDLLVATDKPAEFLKVKAIKDGSAQSITSVPDFQTARRQVADDANVIAYVSPKAAASMIVPTSGDVPLPDWAVLGLAIRDGGIGLSCSTKMDLTKYPAHQGLGQIAAVRKDLFEMLPSGSYGMFAVSDPSNYFDFAQSTMGEKKEMKKQFAEAEDEVQKSLGMSLRHDLLPALKGDAVAALYPSTDGEVAGIDALVVIDDTNGADPANAVERLQTFVEEKTAKQGNAPKMFEEKVIAGGREFRINDKMTHEMRDGIGHSMDDSTIRKDILVGKKTVVFALVGKAVIASTSQELLDRAVASYESKTNGLSGDSKFAPYEKTLLDGSQSFAAFSLSRIAEGIRNTLVTSKMKAEDRKQLNSVLGAFQSLTDPLYIKGKTTSDGQSSGSVFIPLDYGKLLDLFGGQKHSKQRL